MFTKQDMNDIVEVYEVTLDLSLAFKALGIDSKGQKELKKDDYFSTAIAQVEVKEKKELIDELDELIDSDQVGSQVKLGAIKEKMALIDSNKEDPNNIKFPMPVDLSNLPDWR